MQIREQSFIMAFMNFTIFDHVIELLLPLIDIKPKSFRNYLYAASNLKNS